MSKRILRGDIPPAIQTPPRAPIICLIRLISMPARDSWRHVHYACAAIRFTLPYPP